jgi:hypothetical protein
MHERFLLPGRVILQQIRYVRVSMINKKRGLASYVNVFT